jgi:transposase-like protein
MPLLPEGKGKNIIKPASTKSTGHQRYYCKHCETYVIETKGTPLYRKHLSEAEIIEVCKHLAEKEGVRSIERITGHHRDTIGRLAVRGPGGTYRGTE